MNLTRAILIGGASVLMSACNTPEDDIVASYDGIGAEEIIFLGGTEPFWSVNITGETLIYATPDNLDGSQTTVERFAGNGGLSFSGTLDGQPITAAVTPGACSDGMSDRTYPFTATVQLGEKALQGCGHTDKQAFDGEEAP